MEKEILELSRTKVIIYQYMNEIQVMQSLQYLKHYNSIILKNLSNKWLSQIEKMILKQNQLVEFIFQGDDWKMFETHSIFFFLQNLSKLPRLKSLTLLNATELLQNYILAYELGTALSRFISLENLNLIFPTQSIIHTYSAKSINEGLLHLTNLTRFSMNISIEGTNESIQGLKTLIQNINHLSNLKDIQFIIKIIQHKEIELDFIILRESLTYLKHLRKLELFIPVHENNLEDFEAFFDSLFEIQNLSSLYVEICFHSDLPVHLFKNLRVQSNVEELILNLYGKKQTPESKIEFNEDGIMNVSKLKSLTFISKIRISNKEFEKLLKLLSQQKEMLTKLKLEFYCFKVNSYLMAYYLSNLTILKELILEIEYEKEDKDYEFNKQEIIESISKIPNIEVLLLKGDKNFLTSLKGKSYIEDFKRLTSIKTFKYVFDTLQNVRQYVTNSFLNESLQCLKNLVQLEMYLSSKNEANSYIVIIFNTFEHLQNLKVLKFGFDDFIGSEDIIPLRNLINLEELYFEYTLKPYRIISNFHDQIIPMKYLKILKFYSQQISDQQTKQFKMRCFRQQQYLVKIKMTNQSMIK